MGPSAQKSLIVLASIKSYLKILRERMRVVARKPEKGRNHCDIKAGYYSIQVEKHHIYYRIRDAHIEIIDVLEHSMEPKLYIG